MHSVVLLLQLQEGPRLNDAQSGFRASSRSAYKKKGRGSQAYSSMHGFATQTLPPVDPARGAGIELRRAVQLLKPRTQISDLFSVLHTLPSSQKFVPIPLHRSVVCRCMQDMDIYCYV